MRPLLAPLLLLALASLAPSLASPVELPAFAFSPAPPPSLPAEQAPLQEGGFPCTWKAPDGTKYDFSGLTTPTGTAARGKNDDIYSINICGIAQGDSASSTCVSDKAMICMQYAWPPPTWNPIARWSNTPASNPPKFSYIDAAKGAAAGVKLTISNGELGPTDVIVDVHLICSQGEDEYKADHDQINHFTVQVTSKKACGTASGDDGGLSGGWAFIIFLICVTAVYVIAGCLFKHYKQGTQGLESCPNVDFWRDLPALVKDGCKYSMNKVQDLIARCQGKPAGSGGGGSQTYQEFN